MLPRIVISVLVVSFQSWMENVSVRAESTTDAKKPVEYLMINPDGITETKLAGWKKEGFSGIVLTLDERFEAPVYEHAARAIAAHGLDHYYWVEVARNPRFASEHPEWMASLGSHDDWRKQFPKLRQTEEGEVAKAWPWVPIAYRDALDAHIARIKSLLARVPAHHRGLLLNDLQGGPSSCGCGNLHCRWAIDYHVPSTAEKSDRHDIAATFIAKVESLTSGKDVIPVWTTECEQHDMALEKQPQNTWSTGYCGGVNCFNYCLERFSEQWKVLHAAHRGPIAVLALHKELRRSRTEYGPPGNWIKQAVTYLNQKDVKLVPQPKLWVVVQGYDVDIQEEQSARKAAFEVGADVVLVARTGIDQSFEPRIVKINR